LAKPGDEVRAGAPLLELHADDESRFSRAMEALADAVEIGGDYQPSPLVLDRIG
ncbi:MAG: thymidine phosphorylase, partial [Pseudonocardiales bacterium]|nr:thymidine phosphorylase [Pseudonocardiales bacterium]